MIIGGVVKRGLSRGLSRYRYRGDKEAFSLRALFVVALLQRPLDRLGLLLLACLRCCY